MISALPLKKKKFKVIFDHRIPYMKIGGLE